ncbi:hypothetical protein BC830DRAFT_1084925 [Chytriomyces sp. MP71]|nr:hypothetical protein BC830DRAFT_1084925 [Chytriomyces sp. MP71]
MSANSLATSVATSTFAVNSTTTVTGAVSQNEQMVAAVLAAAPPCALSCIGEFNAQSSVSAFCVPSNLAALGACVSGQTGCIQDIQSQPFVNQLIALCSSGSAAVAEDAFATGTAQATGTVPAMGTALATTTGTMPVEFPMTVVATTSKAAFPAISSRVVNTSTKLNSASSVVAMFPLAVAILAASAAVVSAQNMTAGSTTDQAVTVVNTGLNSLPACGQTCIKTLPGYQMPVTLEVITSICNNAQADLTAFVTCTDAQCSRADDINARNVAALVPTGCRFLGIQTNVTIAPLAAATQVATTSTAAMASAKSGASAQAAGVIAFFAVVALMY